jgi:hypothetical protein
MEMIDLLHVPSELTPGVVPSTQYMEGLGGIEL